MNNQKLTELKYWDGYWTNLSLPLVVKKSKKNLFINEILEVFDKFFPKDSRLSILEIGGAPGQYLAYMHENFGYGINCLDYSEVGCMKTIENLDLLNIPRKVYHKDLFSKDLNLPQFDIVYSLGFIEHFSDINTVVNKHLSLLKTGGILLLGVPNLLGVNHLFLRKLSPKNLARHNLTFMDIQNWQSFEDKFNLEPLYKGYIGGFEPGIFKNFEQLSILNGLLLTVAWSLYFLFHSHFKVLRKLNSRFISGYLIGVYRKTSV